MHSFLIISKNKENIQNKTSKILKENKIDLFDQSFFTFEKTAGVEDIKKTSEKLYLKPFKSEKKAIILDLSLGITPEAQNSLLKTLEEPPANTIIIITAGNIEDFLPTIISRCKVYELKISQISDVDPVWKDLVERILKSGEGEKMGLAWEFGKDRDTALNFVEQTVLTASNLAKKENTQKYLELLKNFNEAYTVIKLSNVNPRLILEDTLLNF